MRGTSGPVARASALACSEVSAESRSSPRMQGDFPVVYGHVGRATQARHCAVVRAIMLSLPLLISAHNHWASGSNFSK